MHATIIKSIQLYIILTYLFGEVTKMETKKIVDQYLRAWQKGDAETLASLISEKGTFGSSRLSSKGLVSEILKSPVWRDVRMINSVYDEDGNAAILYEGTDTQTGQRVRSSEFITVDNGKISSFDALIVGGAAIAGRDSGLNFIANDAI